MDKPDYITMKMPEQQNRFTISSDAQLIEDMPVSGDKPLFFPWDKVGTFKEFASRLRSFVRQVKVREGRNRVNPDKMRKFSMRRVKHGAFDGVGIWRTK